MDTPRRCLALVQLVGMEALEARLPAAMARARTEAAARTRDLADATGGTLARSSVRGMSIVFDEAASALTFASRLHQALLAIDWPAPLLLHDDAAEVRDPDGVLLYRGLRARVAVHRGPFTDDEDGLRGPAVYQGARLLHAAHAGQTLLSADAWRHLRGSLPSGTVLRDLGSHTLRGVQGTTRLLQLLPGDLDRRRFPPGLADRVATRRRPLLVGREGDLEALRELLALGVRWLEIQGDPGVGRARVGRQLAAVPPPGFLPERVIALPMRRGEALEVLRTVADSIGVPLARARDRARATEQLGHALLAMGPTLLFFDGPAPDPELVRGWLALAPELRVVVLGSPGATTSGATAYRLRPLRSATEAVSPRHGEAVRLYVGAASQARPDFHLEEPLDAAVVAKALEGNGLALRLAGGAVTEWPPDRLAAQWMGRRASVADVVGLVIEPLADDLRALLDVCSVPAGAFEPEHVRALLETPMPREEVVAGLRELTRRSLLRRPIDNDLAQIARFAMPVPVRAHLEATLDADWLAGRRRLLEANALERCAYWAYRAFERNRPEVLARLALDADTLLDAIDRGLSEGGAEGLDRAFRAVFALEPVLRSRGPLSLELELLDRCIDVADRTMDNDPVLQVRGLIARADCRFRAGLPGSASDLERAEALADRWGDRAGSARALLIHGRLAMARDAGDEALEALVAAQDHFLELGDAMRAALARGLAGAVHLRCGRLLQAEEALVDAATRLRDLEAIHLLARVLGWKAEMFRRTGRTDAARAVTRETIRLHEELGAVVAECRARHDLATLDYQLTRYGEASDGLAVAIQRARAVGDRHQESRAVLLLAVVSLARADHAEARRHLLEALALCRERRDATAEGEVLGYLALLHHLDEQPAAARGYFVEARRRLHQQRDHRREALFTAWQSELEAEQLELEASETHLAAAHRALDKADDRQTRQALLLLGQVRLLARGVLDGDAEGGRQALREQLKGTDPRNLSAEARLAFRRVRRLAARGLLVRQPPPVAGEAPVAD